MQRISFIGNQVFSDRRLRRVIETNQTNWLSFVFGGNTYDADRLELDRELLRQFYLERGYIDFQVLSSTAEIVRERTGFFLSFTISEGQRYNFGQVSVSSSDPGPQRGRFPAAAGAGGRTAASTTSSWSTGSIQRMTYQAGQAGLRLRRDPAAGDQERGGAHRRHQLRARRGAAGLRRAHRHHRQHPHARPGDPPAVPTSSRATPSTRARSATPRTASTASATSRRRRSTCGRAPTQDQALVDVEVEEQPTGSLSLGGAFSSSEGLSARRSA